MYNLWCFVSLNCCKISFTLFCQEFFIAIYVLLCGENVSVEKNGQISSMCLRGVWSVVTNATHDNDGNVKIDLKL